MNKYVWRLREAAPLGGTRNGEGVQRLQWATCRLTFLVAMGLAAVTGVGAYLLSPYFSYCLFGDLRFWRYQGLWHRLLGRLYYFLFLSLKGSVALRLPLWDPPMMEPDPSRVMLNPSWEHAGSCGDCFRCCEKLRCPLLDRSSGRCLSYGSLYWRYFNCGRYPSTQRDIDIYQCPKWISRDGNGGGP